MAQKTLPVGRVGQIEQERAYATDALIEVGGPEAVAGAVRFVIKSQDRLSARNAMREASSRVYAANNFR